MKPSKIYIYDNESQVGISIFDKSAIRCIRIKCVEIYSTVYCTEYNDKNNEIDKLNVSDIFCGFRWGGSVPALSQCIMGLGSSPALGRLNPILKFRSTFVLTDCKGVMKEDWHPTLNRKIGFMKLSSTLLKKIPLKPYKRYSELNKCRLSDGLKATCNSMDRILRPEGTVVMRDNVETLTKVERITKGMKWNTQIVDHGKGPYNPEKILVAVKTYWTGQPSNNNNNN
ncbi:hypothetical protein YC2023_018322 [Brassica napus]